MPKLETKAFSVYFFGLGGFILALIFFPYYLGSLIAANQWSVFGILILGCVLITLFFSDFHLTFFFAGLFLMFAVCQVEWLLALAITLRWVFLTAMAVSAITQWFWSREMRIRLLDLWAVLFFALAFYSQTYSIVPQLTFERTVSSLLFFFSIFWGVRNYANSPERILKIVKNLLWIVFIAMSLGVFWIQKGRFIGFFSNANSIGLCAALFIPIVLWEFCSEKNKASAYLLVLMSFSLLLSQSRGALLSAVFGAGYFLLVYYQKMRHGILLGIFFAAGLLFLGIELFGASFFKDYLRWDNLILGSGRIEAWKEVLRLVSMRPFLGYGYGTEDQLFEKFDIVFLEHAGNYAHNSYIGLLSQLGILGCVLFFAPLLLFFIKNMLEIQALSPQDEFHSIRIAFQASILAGLVNAVFESWLFSAGNPFAFCFWTMVALALCAGEVRSPIRQRALAS